MRACPPAVTPHDAHIAPAASALGTRPAPGGKRSGALPPLRLFLLVWVTHVPTVGTHAKRLGVMSSGSAPDPKPCPQIPYHVPYIACCNDWLHACVIFGVLMGEWCRKILVHGRLQTVDASQGSFFVWFYLYVGSAFTVVTADKACCHVWVSVFLCFSLTGWVSWCFPGPACLLLEACCGVQV